MLNYDLYENVKLHFDLNVLRNIRKSTTIENNANADLSPDLCVHDNA
jgi:hypothetical protein